MKFMFRAAAVCLLLLGPGLAGVANAQTLYTGTPVPNAGSGDAGVLGSSGERGPSGTAQGVLGASGSRNSGATTQVLATSGTRSGGLAFTGSDITGLLSLGVGALLVGVFLTVRARQV